MSVNVYDPINDKLIPVAGATLYADTPIGAIQAFDAEEVPDGWLIFNGQTVLRSDYPDLWARASRNGQVGVGKFYGIGDGATTFTLADLRETSLKGYGETSRSVGAHVKSGGLAVGEFIEDRLQEHFHVIKTNNTTEGASDTVREGAQNNLARVNSQGVIGARNGATTEVKAVGVVWAVKARMTGLPIDLKAEVEKIATKFPDYAHPISIPSGTTTWTATEDCYVVQYYFTESGMDAALAMRLTIDGNIVGVADSVGQIVFTNMFSGYVKKGQVVSTVGGGMNLAFSQTIKFFPLSS